MLIWLLHIPDASMGTLIHQRRHFTLRQIEDSISMEWVSGTKSKGTVIVVPHTVRFETLYHNSEI